MTRGERVIAFIERYCLVPEGKLVGKPVRLVPFQRKFILEVYDNPAGTTEGILSIARKNGKSALIACILLAHLAGPEARLNSQIVSGARSRDQAALVFNLASKMISLSPDLSKLIRIVPSGKRLIGLALNVEYRALAADGHTAHGLSPVLAILDELGQVRGPQDDFVEAIETASGAYDDALRLIISTQAPTDADMLSIKIDDAVRSRDPKIVAHVYAAEKDADVLDTKAHAAANPALGLFRSLPELLAAAEKASRMPSAENGFRNLYLNQRVNRFSPFISPGVWGATNGAIDDAVFADGVVYGGLDLAETTDLVAFVLIAQDDHGCWHVKAWFWKPAATVSDHTKRDRVPYNVWVDQGLIETTPGVAVDYEYVARQIADTCAPYQVAKIGYDRYRFKTLEAQMQKIGVALPFEPMGQGYVSMAPAMDVVEIDFLNGNIRHGGNPVLTMCAANAVVIKDPAGNRKLDKAKSIAPTTWSNSDHGYYVGFPENDGRRSMALISSATVSPGSAVQGVRTDVGYSTGKHRFELTLTKMYKPDNTQLGLATESFNLNASNNDGSAYAGDNKSLIGYLEPSDTAIVFNNAAVGKIAPMAVGDSIVWDVDLDAKTASVQVYSGGSPNGSALTFSIAALDASPLHGYFSTANGQEAKITVATASTTGFTQWGN